MKKFLSLTAVLFIYMALNSCITQNANALALQKKWMMVSFKNYKKEDLVKAKAGIDFTDAKTKPGQYAAYMGCNRMFFTADFKPNGAVKFSDVGSTMMYCDKMMDLETQFAKELPQMTRYKIEGHFLALSAENGGKMKFVAEDWD